jgi:hypothetical protein
MRILDEQDNELESYDEDAGYITEETIVVAHHDAVEAVDAVRKKVIDWQNPDDETNYQYHWEIETRYRSTGSLRRNGDRAALSPIHQRTACRAGAS